MRTAARERRNMIHRETLFFLTAIDTTMVISRFNFLPLRYREITDGRRRFVSPSAAFIETIVFAMGLSIDSRIGLKMLSMGLIIGATLRIPARFVVLTIHCSLESDFLAMCFSICTRGCGVALPMSFNPGAMIGVGFVSMRVIRCPPSRSGFFWMLLAIALLVCSGIRSCCLWICVRH
jgi:hypothetical protein